ncbi:MAG: sporulation protein YunB [Clostridia bacterium]|nr:sporulation protein YunB [Clostridia bacterium]
MRGRSKNSAALFVKLFITVVLIAALCFVSDMRMTPVINTLALSRAQNLATVIINDTVADMLSSGGESFNELIKIEYDAAGKISALTADSVKMNRLKSLISVSITEAIGRIEESRISIAIGTLTGSTFLTGRGPKIDLNVHISCSCSIEVRNSFEYSGINQTMHKVLLDITTNVYVISVGETLTSEVFTSIPVAETVIIGQIPEIYAGKDDALWQDLIN